MRISFFACPNDDAKSICLSQEIGDPKLIQINSKEEQQFIENLLFSKLKILCKNVYNNVWLGARLNNETNEFHWEGKNEPISGYENFGQLRNSSEYECLEIILYGSDKGKWINTPCRKKNIVVCQKLQRWSLERLHKEFLQFTKQNQLKEQELNKQINKSKEEIRDLKEKIKELKEENEKLKKELIEEDQRLNRGIEALFKEDRRLNGEIDTLVLEDRRFNTKIDVQSIPIGFIYTQLPFESSPNVIWPHFVWQEVTNQYAN